MHVGLNFLFLIPGDTGGRETYSRELFRSMRTERPDIRFTAFIGREASQLKRDSWLGELDTATVPVNVRSRSEWAFGEQFLLPRAARRADIALLHSTANTAPLCGPFRRVVTIHDLFYKRYPKFLSPVARAATSLIVAGAARTAHKIITASEASGEEIANLLHVRRDRIHVVPHGVGTPPSDRQTPIAELRTRFGFGSRPFILVSAIQMPHKNLPTLVDALALIPKERRPLLALAGPPGPDGDAITQRVRARRVEGDVISMGWLEQCDLEGLFAGAVCLVLPSLYEGFGLPVLEAMSRDLPVACSDIGPLREVTGGAALLFDPVSPRSIADSVERMIGSPVDRARLVLAGRAQVGLFSWKRAAQKTLSIYERAISDR